jgi:hypothetical protein
MHKTFKQDLTKEERKVLARLAGEFREQIIAQSRRKRTASNGQDHRE